MLLGIGLECYHAHGRRVNVTKEAQQMVVSKVGLGFGVVLKPLRMLEMTTSPGD